jgi:hypothetical protein
MQCRLPMHTAACVDDFITARLHARHVLLCVLVSVWGQLLRPSSGQLHALTLDPGAAARGFYRRWNQSTCISQSNNCFEGPCWAGTPSLAIQRSDGRVRGKKWHRHLRKVAWPTGEARSSMKKLRAALKSNTSQPDAHHCTCHGVERGIQHRIGSTASSHPMTGKALCHAIPQCR